MAVIECGCRSINNGWTRCAKLQAAFGAQRDQTNTDSEHWRTVKVARVKGCVDASLVGRTRAYRVRAPSTDYHRDGCSRETGAAAARRFLWKCNGSVLGVRTNHQQQAGRSTEKAQDKTPPIEPTTNGVLIGQVNSTVRIPKRINTSTKTSLASFQATKKERRQKFICLSELQCLGEYCTTATVQLARYEKQDTEVQRLGSRGS